MARRWLVTLAMFVVSIAGGELVVEASTSKVTATKEISHGTKRHEHTTLAGDVYVKTDQSLVALDPDGRIRWSQPTTSPGGAIAITATAIVDGWIDLVRNRYGIAKYDPRTGRCLASIDLGSTRGWHDVARLDVAPDGPSDVLVSAAFGCG
jgi:outer membrane protein assembly factor BamB